MPNSHRPTRLDKTVSSRHVGVGDVNWILSATLDCRHWKFEVWTHSEQ